MSMVSVERSDGIALVRYDRGGSANALNEEAITELSEVARALRKDDSLQAVILTGTPRGFCAGIDLADSALWGEGALAMTPLKSAELGKVLCENWAALPQVTIAAIEGVAIGGGALLAQALDWRVMARSASMYLPEARLGFNLAWGGVPRLVSLVGAARAKRALLTDFTLDAHQAETWGLADAIAEDGGAVDVAMRLAEETLNVPATTQRMTKRAVAAQVEASHLAHADAEQFLLCAWMAERTGE